ncbi:hypothetical protein JKP88DRAFT_169813, partial [Tribonema minus]
PPADDPNKTMVNHIDSNPRNNEFTNLEWVTAGGNSRHTHTTRLCSKRRPVHLYSLTGNKIWAFLSITEAAEYLNRRNKKACGSSITECCRHRPRCTSAYGFKWEYADVTPDDASK